MLDADFAETRARWLCGSLLQSGKYFLLAVTQTRTLPLVLRRPVTFIVSVEAPAGAAASARLALPSVALKAAKAKIGAANFVPETEI